MRTAFVLTVLSLSFVIGVPSAQARFSTEALLYQGGHTIITEYRPRHWDITECDYTGGIVYTSPRRHRVIFVHTTVGLTVGIGHVLPNGRYAVWAHEPFSDKADHPGERVGTVVRRSPMRWDILHEGKKIGWARGPDGREAATAVLTICQ
jgi:hypothetical protein